MIPGDHDHKPCRADAKLGQMLQVGSLNPFIVYIRPVRGIQVAYSNHILGQAHDAVQTRDLRVIYFDVRAPTNLSYAGFCLGQLVRQCRGRTCNDGNFDRPVTADRGRDPSATQQSHLISMNRQSEYRRFANPAWR